jgi:hypothetical protein
MKKLREEERGASREETHWCSFDMVSFIEKAPPIS